MAGRHDNPLAAHTPHPHNTVPPPLANPNARAYPLPLTEEGASLLQVLQQVQAHFGGAVFGILRVQPLSLVETQCPVKGGLE